MKRTAEQLIRLKNTSEMVFRLFFVSALGFTFFAVQAFFLKPSLSMSLLPVRAVVCDFDDRSDYQAEPREIRWIWYVDYTVHGEEYRHIALDMCADRYALGEKLWVYYTPSDPTDIAVSKYMFEFQAVITVLALFSWAVLIHESLVLRRIRREREEGKETQ